MRYGSFCSGIGGLDLAVEAVFDATPAWFCEADQGAASVLHRWWPGVPVLPDLTTQEWADVEPAELVCAGYPCQPFSTAGLRLGADDPRHLWPHVVAAVRVLRPRIVVLENVSGHLGLGFDAVLCDLAEAGFDAEWATVRASDAGAPHRRERLFAVAHDPRWPAPDADGGRLEARCEPHSGPVEPGLGASRRCDAHRRGTAPADPDDLERQRGGPPRRRWDGSTDGGATAPDPHSEGPRRAAQEQAGSFVGGRTADDDLAAVWGDYGSAIDRWEHVLGRPAPQPTDEKGRLSVPFVTWMMGFPAGWVDDLARTAALRCLGNAVVPQQGALALAHLADAA